MSNDSQVSFRQTADGVELSFEESIYPRDAVFGAAYVLLDRAYVHLDRDGTRLVVSVRPKPGVELVASCVAGELENEALAQSWRRAILEESRPLVESLTTRALAGAAGPPGLDDLLEDNLGDGADAFDDPLGIAVSWEDKYGKKAQPPGAAEARGTEEAPAGSSQAAVPAGDAAGTGADKP
jgi:His-Xaa-Ser system protein HxsD